MTATDLYRYYNTNDELLYVGISLHAAARASQHKTSQPWWPQVARIDIERYDDRTSALEAEQEAICTERPIYNVVHNLKREMTTDDPVAILPFSFPYRMAELFDAQRALDKLARKLDDRAGEPGTPTRAEFITLVERITRSLVYGDCCNNCRNLAEINYPVQLEFKDSQAVAYYSCRNCLHVWRTYWTRDLAVLGAIG